MVLNDMIENKSEIVYVFLLVLNIPYMISQAVQVIIFNSSSFTE